MSSEQDQIRSLAGRIARRLSNAAEHGDAARGGTRAVEDGDELTTLRAHLSEIQQRLAHVESHLTNDEPCAHEAHNNNTSNQHQANASTGVGQPSGATVTRSPWLSGTYVPATSHPSEQRFTGITEDVSELVDYFEREKTCNVEPGGKPCDHCGMCSSRGF
ncbi:MAG: hypothetical protein LC754_05415 [Acidobacteria bacterium]|nr:hypothetical protein [Acidobacteriota bacterium]